MIAKKHIKVLWCSPNLNHYKIGPLNHLASDPAIDLSVFVGETASETSEQNVHIEPCFKQIKVDVPKKDFGKSKLVKSKLKSIFSEFDWIMIPVEKKNILLFLYALKLRKHHKNVRLFSYNHPVLKSGHGRITPLDRWLTKFYYKRLDRVVFYTEQGCQWAISHRYVQSSKAFWANNTIDSSEIEKHYAFQYPPENQINILYIGRLSQRKRIPDLIAYHKQLKQIIPNLRLEIVGIGPESHLVTTAAASDESILWHGEVVQESEIAPIMKRAALVFVPGHTGLAVNHAFAYGRPFITLEGPSHAPEVDYIDHGNNGYILDADMQANITTIKTLLTNKNTLERFCDSAKAKGVHLKIQNWVDQMKQNLINA